MAVDFKNIIDAQKQKSRRNTVALVLIAVAVFVTMYALVLPGVAWEQTLICEQEEHTHTADCYQAVTTPESKELTCTLAEHVHSDECYVEQKVLVCTETEGEGHTHTDACYETQKVLTCTLVEHTHTDACYTIIPETSNLQLVCGKEEHVHTDACYDAPRDETGYYCGNTEHEHTLACMSNPNADVETQADWEATMADVNLSKDWATDVVAIAKTQVGYAESTRNFIVDEDGETIHGYTRYGAWYGDTYGEWCAMFASFVLHYAQVTDITLEGNCQRWINALSELDAQNALSDADAIAIAQEQGDEEAYNEAVAAATNRHVYWYRADAVADADTIAAVANNASNAEELAAAATASGLYIPKAGDLVFFDWDTIDADDPDALDKRVSDHVGIVVEFKEATDTTPAYLVTIEGNNNKRVSYVTRELSDSTIMGYVSLPENPALEDEEALSGLSLVLMGASPVTATEETPLLAGATLGATATAKPTYPEYITPSAATDTTETQGANQVTIQSDAATSQLESLFAGTDADDGKVVTDKSVVYEDDDYDAFSSYDENEFGVTLSALAQDYSITEEMEVSTPLDVVFVLDVSGSMITTTNKAGKTSASVMVESLNEIIDFIQKENPNNRVGVVCFSGNSYQLLPLGRYKVNGTAEGATPEFFPNGDYTDRDADFAPNSNIRYEDGSAVSYGTFTAYWGGTYTQAGIAQGSQILENVTDTTVTSTVTKGGVTAEYTTTRRPCMLLLSDGEPTYCTSDYSDVLNASKMYGSGSSAKANNQGVLGYYTVMTAQACKDKIETQYKTDAFIYSVGLGINETGTASASSSSEAGDDYKRAVLNPSADNIAFLNNCGGSLNVNTTCKQMYQLLNNSYSGSTITVGKYDKTQYGERKSKTYADVPVVANPYSDYAYADGSYFSTDVTVANLTAAFKTAIETFEDFPVYSFLLQANTSVDIADPIGDGMEVKSEPVLRYGGTNYSPSSHTTSGDTTTYFYTGTYTDAYMNRTVDISKITATVTTATDGTQTVALHVPDSAIPAYVPSLAGDGSANFYYEMLPVRLIYKVGLTAASQSAVAALTKDDAPLTFYTNRYTTTVAESEYRPTESNDYFGSSVYSKDPVLKAKDVTGTGTFVRKYQTASQDTDILQQLGNNGKLTFASATISIPVAKTWNMAESATEPASVTVGLYKKSSDNVVSPVQDSSGNNITVTLTASTEQSSNWKGTLTDVPVPATGETYYIVETAIAGSSSKAGFVDSYTNQENITIDGNTVAAGKVDTSSASIPTTTITNYSGSALPVTGGIGTWILYAIGAVLILGGVGVLVWRRLKRK